MMGAKNSKTTSPGGIGTSQSNLDNTESLTEVVIGSMRSTFIAVSHLYEELGQENKEIDTCLETLSLQEKKNKSKKKIEKLNVAKKVAKTLQQKLIDQSVDRALRMDGIQPISKSLIAKFKKEVIAEHNRLEEIRNKKSLVLPSDDSSADPSEDSSKDSSEDSPVDSSEDSPVDSPEDSPVDSPEDSPVDSPEDRR